MAKRIRLGRRTELPLCALGGYISSGGLLLVGSVQDLSSTIRGPLMIAAIIAFFAGGLIHILDKIDLHNEEMCTKIDDSVGDVYDTGVAAGERHRDLMGPEIPKLAAVHDLSPR